MAPKPSVRAGVPPASDASAGSPARGGPRRHWLGDPPVDLAPDQTGALSTCSFRSC